MVVASGDDIDALKAFARDVAPRLEALPAVRYVEYEQPYSWFEDRGLYFADLEDLEEAHRRLRRRVKYEKNKKNPMYIELDDEPAAAPSLDFSDLADKYTDKTGDSIDADPYYADAARGQLAVLIKPNGLGADLDFAKTLVADVEDVLGTPPAGIEFQLSGRFKKWPDQQKTVVADLAVCTVVALLGMLFYLIFHFRRIAALALVMLPLGVAFFATTGIAAFVFGQLNVLTGLVGAILLGLGIDHGIHLLGRYEAERDVEAAFGETGKAVAIAALTTLGAFGAIASSEFRAFHELGVVAGYGMLCAVAAYLTLMPALIGLFEHFGWSPREAPAVSKSWYASLIDREPKKVLVACLALTALVSSAVWEAGFDYDFGSLEPRHLPSFVLDSDVNALLGYDELPVVVLTSDKVAEQAVVAELQRRKRAAGSSSTIKRIASIGDLVPGEQPQKHARLKKIARTLKKVKDQWVPDEHRENFDKLKRMVLAEPFERADLPEALRQQYGAVGAHINSGQVMAFPAVSTRDGRRIMDLTDEVTNIPIPGGQTVSAAGDTIVIGALLHALRSEVGPILGLTLAIVLVVMWVLLGRLSTALLCLAPGLLTFLLMAGLMGWSGVKLNYFNVAFVPVLFGVAVDGGVHIVTRHRDGASAGSVVAETGRAITGALLTTAFGFGALLLAEHPGLRSVGELMLLGLVANFVACLVALPAGLSTLHGAKRTGQDA